MALGQRVSFGPCNGTITVARDGDSYPRTRVMCIIMERLVQFGGLSSSESSTMIR
jgi:hypothetical protein